MSTESNPYRSRGLKMAYQAGIAPLITSKEYKDLIANYKQTGQFPHILKLGGMAIDTSQNRNKWRVPMEDLQDVAAQLVGAPLMKDHDIDHVDSIIGKVEEAWVEADANDKGIGKVFWKGECSDESLIQKILLGYVKFNSIQIAVPQAYCDDCMTTQGKSEEQAAIADLDLPCPRCGGLNMLIRHPMVLEQSMVAIPAYPHAEVTPVGFKASLDRALQKRFDRGITVTKTKKAMPDLTPYVIKARFMVNTIAIAAMEIGLKMANIELDGADDCQCEAFYPDQCPSCLAKSQGLGMADTREKDEAGGSLKDFPLVEKGKKESGEGYEEDYYCPVCGRDEPLAHSNVCYAEYMNNPEKYKKNKKEAMSGEDDEDEGMVCSSCGGYLAELGNLGNKTWYRCRNCGMEESR